MTRGEKKCGDSQEFLAGDCGGKGCVYPPPNPLQRGACDEIAGSRQVGTGEARNDKKER